MQGDPPHTHKVADSADESLKLLFSEDRIMYMAVLSTFATRKSKWQTYCFGLVFSLNRVLKVRSTFPAYLMVSGPMFPFIIKDAFMSKLPQVLLAVGMVQFQNKNIPPIC